jgi:hypothetical protein
VAGNYAVWCRNRTYEVYWLELRRSDTKKLRLPVIDHFSPMDVEDLLVSEGGIVFVRGILEGELMKIYRFVFALSVLCEPRQKENEADFPFYFMGSGTKRTAFPTGSSCGTRTPVTPK